MLMYHSEVKIIMMKVQSSDMSALQVGISSINNIIQTTVQDLNFLSEQKDLVEMVSITNHIERDNTVNDWLVFSRIKGAHDQIRWLDSTGMEKIRINYNKGKPISVQEDKLQNKGNRYYFSDTVKLNRSEIFISPLDLNVEKGVIEQPLKPMIRIGTPIFDLEGRKKGIILLNFFGDKLLKKFSVAMGENDSRAWLLNSGGYWLKGPSTELEWGFMYERLEATMSYQYPNAWKRILDSESGQFEDEDGLWTFITVYPLLQNQKSSSGTHDVSAPRRSSLESNEYFWKAILYRPKEAHNDSIKQTAANTVMATVALLFTLFIGSWMLASSWVRQKLAKEDVFRLNKSLEQTIEERTKELQEVIKQTEEIARTDVLTGLQNRRAFFDRGGLVAEQAKRYKHKYSIIMLDLDWFKKINDTYGHLAGDQVLIATAGTIKDIVRITDISARIGGEEFAILMPESSAETAVELAERLRLAIEKLAVLVDGNILNITASFGIAEYTDETCSIEDILRNADKALYLAKDQGRNKVSLFQKA